MVREALAYIKATYLSTTVVKHRGRAEADRVSNFPYEAIEEALVNAVYHRDYSVREPVEVTITGYELTVMSYPGPDRSVKTSELAKGHVTSRRYRNRRLGEFLEELDLTEGRGTGIPKILRAMKENGSPRPKGVINREDPFGDARRLKHLEDENNRLKKLLADQMLDYQALKLVLRFILKSRAHGDPECPSGPRSPSVMGLARVSDR